MGYQIFAVTLQIAGNSLGLPAVTIPVILPYLPASYSVKIDGKILMAGWI